MSARPDVKPGDWITVGNTSCVVANVFNEGHSLGDCEVVFNQAKPANLNARWDGERWQFVKTGDYGGYADKYPRLSAYVAQLKRGRGA